MHIYLTKSEGVLALTELEMRHLVLFLYLLCEKLMDHVTKVMTPSINIFCMEVKTSARGAQGFQIFQEL